MHIVLISLREKRKRERKRERKEAGRRGKKRKEKGNKSRPARTNIRSKGENENPFLEKGCVEEKEEEEEERQRARSKKYRVTTNTWREMGLFKKEVAIDEIKNGTILA